MAGRMYLGSQMVTPVIEGVVESVNGKTGNVVLDASDVGALPDTTKYAKTLGLSMNTTTYVLSWQLYDQNGDAIGDVQTVDLPLESVVVSGTYDNTNKKIILTLQNGSTIDVPVGDLVEGLQSEITITNMLSSDLVDDTNKTHKFVTAEEKTTWNNKQNAIDDLETIRSGAALGATAVQPSQLGTAAYQPSTAFATSAQGTKADTAIQGVQINGTELTPDTDKKVNVQVPTNTSQLTNDAGFITSLALNGYATQTWVEQQGYLTSTALNGYATEQWVSQQGYLTSITSSDVTTALGYIPYNSTNPSGYITSSALSGYQTTANLVTSISSSSTDSQYPSAKCVYDIIGNIETLLSQV